MPDEPQYADLNQLLELMEEYTEYRDLVALVGLTELSNLALEVKLKSINALLLGRAPDVLDPTNTERFDLFLETLAGATAEVEAVLGEDPQPAGRRALALRAIAYATAAELEFALFPEQELGDDARGQYLRRRFDELMATLRDNDGSPPDGVPGPIGSFPEPECYPDPVAPLAQGHHVGPGWWTSCS